MSLNKTLKALLLGSVAISLTGAGAAHASPDSERGPEEQYSTQQFFPGSSWNKDNPSQMSNPSPNTDNIENQDPIQQFPGSRWNKDNPSQMSNPSPNTDNIENQNPNQQFPGSSW